MRAILPMTCILAGAIGVLFGMNYWVTGTQHGVPATPAEAASYATATWIGVALVASGILLQVGPAVSMMRSSWRSGPERRLRRPLVLAVAFVVGLALVVAGAGYLADGVQKGAPGGRGVGASGAPDPAFDGGRGEAGSLPDMWLGGVLMLVGVLAQLGVAFIDRRQLSNNSFQPTARTS